MQESDRKKAEEFADLMRGETLATPENIEELMQQKYRVVRGADGVDRRELISQDLLNPES